MAEAQQILLRYASIMALDTATDSIRYTRIIEPGP